MGRARRSPSAKGTGEGTGFCVAEIGGDCFNAAVAKRKRAHRRIPANFLSLR
jgi:hypothetical protein